MEKDSELERYLGVQKEEGSTVSQGAFTLAHSKALRKLASFQLPFEGAWALKLIQCAVASSHISSIKVKLTKKESQFWLRGRWKWSLEEIEQALSSPNLQGDSSLQHLVGALRTVGFHEKRGFSIELPHLEEAILWNNESLGRLPCQTNPHSLVVRVSNSAQTDEGGLFGYKSPKAARKRVASTTQVLSNRAHMCPISLTLDGRRLDALELNPDHGFSPQSQLLALGFQDGELPTLRIPLSTGLKKTRTPVQGRALPSSLERTLQKANLPQSCSLVYLVSRSPLLNETPFKQFRKRASSSCSWVKDGVIVQIEKLERHSGGSVLWASSCQPRAWRRI